MNLPQERAKLAIACREQWLAADRDELFPNIGGLTQDEQHAVAFAALDGREGDGVEQHEIMQLLQEADRAKRAWGMFQMAILNVIYLKHENGQTSTKVTQSASETLAQPLREIGML
ncbi:MAG: hypothetical protein K2X38_06705 [Gemmataceae bacterium]|nr:hypothetical protein [Gemmataceae bacterium]